MLINNNQALQTIDKLKANHQKVVDEFAKKNKSSKPSLDEVIKNMNALNALSTYNLFKSRYQ